MMERIEKEPTLSAQMKKNEPTLVPEWLKTATGGSIGNGGSSQIFGSSLNSDYRASGILTRNRLSVNTCDRSNSLVFKERSPSSYHRSLSTNGSRSHNKNKPGHTRSYSCLGRSHHGRDWDQDIDFHGRKRLINFGNGFDSVSTRSENDTLLRSLSLIEGKHDESRSKMTGNGTAIALSSGSTVSNISKVSFESEFPSLVAEERQGPPEIVRVTSPGLSNAAQSLPLGSSATVVGDGWTSALAEVPVIKGGSGPLLSSVKQIVPVSTPASISSAAPSTTTGLNMAETLAQVPRARAAPQLPIETQKLEELAIKQSRQLIPMTPSMPKALVLNSSDKPKPKGSRSGDFSTLMKVGQPSSGQLVNNTVRGSSRSDILKPSQIGGFQVLNREKNCFSPTAVDCPSLTNAVRALNPLGVAPSAAIAPLLNGPSKVKVDGKANGLPLTTFTEKRPVSQQNRSDFFNSLRKKMSANHSSSSSETTSCQLANLEKSNEHIIGGSASVDTHAKGTSASDYGLDYSMENVNCTTGALGAGEDFVSSPTSNGEKNSCLDPQEEERLLRLFGWIENAGEEEEALTAEEIDAFIEECQKLRPSSKFCRRLVKTMLPEVDGGASASSPSETRAEE